MYKRLGLVLALVFTVSGIGGCRFVAGGLEDIGGCPHSTHATGCDTKTRAIIRQWARDARENEQFIDQYFLNYNIHDPYRGDCIVGY